MIAFQMRTVFYPDLGAADPGVWHRNSVFCEGLGVVGCGCDASPQISACVYRGASWVTGPVYRLVLGGINGSDERKSK